MQGVGSGRIKTNITPWICKIDTEKLGISLLVDHQTALYIHWESNKRTDTHYLGISSAREDLAFLYNYDTGTYAGQVYLS